MFWWSLVLVIGSGAFGGFLSAIHLNDGKIWLPSKLIQVEDGSKYLTLGLWADIILGIGAGLIATLPLGLSGAQAVYVALLAGFGGGNFIAKQAKLVEQARNKANHRLPVLPTAHKIEGEEQVLELDITDTGGDPGEGKG